MTVDTVSLPLPARHFRRRATATGPEDGTGQRQLGCHADGTFVPLTGGVSRQLTANTSRLVLWIVAALMLAACGGAAGAGEITFGSALNDNLEITGGAKSSFRSGDNFAWRAVLSEPAGATSLRVLIARVTGDTERAVDERTITVTDAEFNVFGNELPVANLGLTEAGTYVMRISRGATTLAEGTFNYSP